METIDAEVGNVVYLRAPGAAVSAASKRISALRAHANLTAAAATLHAQFAEFRDALGANAPNAECLHNLALSLELFRLTVAMIDPRRLPPQATLLGLTRQARNLGDSILREVQRLVP
jgi:hypothetical protein